MKPAVFFLQDLPAFSFLFAPPPSVACSSPFKTVLPPLLSPAPPSPPASPRPLPLLAKILQKSISGPSPLPPPPPPVLASSSPAPASPVLASSSPAPPSPHPARPLVAKIHQKCFACSTPRPPPPSSLPR